MITHFSDTFSPCTNRKKKEKKHRKKIIFTGIHIING